MEECIAREQVSVEKDALGGLETALRGDLCALLEALEHSLLFSDLSTCRLVYKFILYYKHLVV